MVNFVIATGLISTLVMTAFSYLLSYVSGNKFEEPQLINTLFRNHPKSRFKFTDEHVVGWTIHVLIGILFVILFEVGHQFLHFKITYGVGALFGFIAGLVGAGSWMLFFTFHPNPPNIHRGKYYLQLIPAHVLFGFTMAFSYLVS